MNPSSCTKLGLTLASALLLTATTHADQFGTLGNEFTLDFVSVLNAGNTDDLGAGGGLYSSPHGGVLYEYRMGTFEISQEQIEKATASGLASVVAGAHTGAEPGGEPHLV
jgi:hypothetical protein